MKFRLKYVDGLGWFAHVKHLGLFSYWFTDWKRIGTDPNGFMLYDVETHHYPMATEGAARERVSLYKKWYKERDNAKTIYKYL